MTRTIVIGIVASLLVVGSAQAGFVVLDGIKDVSAFDYGYEADALPEASVPVWVGAGVPLIETATGGILRIWCGVGMYRQYTADVAWDAFIAAEGPAWTIEMRAHPTAGMTRGIALGAGLGTTANPNSRWCSIEVKADRVELNGNTVSPIWLGDNTAYHTYRIVADSGALFYNIYRDDVLIKEDATTAARAWGIRFGDGGGTETDNYHDYIRWTAGSWAPIPEPATLAVLLCGVAIMSLRRRR